VTWKAEVETWFRGLLGDPLSRALAAVRASAREGTIEQVVRPEVQAFADAIDRLRQATADYLALAAPQFGADPQLRERADRLVQTYQLLHAQFLDGASPLQGGAVRGVVGAVPVMAALIVVAVGAVSYAVSEVGAAYAVAARSSAEEALARTELETRELQARIEATRTGVALPPTTLALPPPPSSPLLGDGKAEVVMLAVGAGVAALGFLAWISRR
jgi:hypothetical protein